MTFKHNKFDDSPVLRSLEKIAIDKGIIKNDVPTKSVKSLVEERDFSPTGNLSQDILRLCAGLRKSNLHSHASELEEKFLKFKTANTLYQTSKEKGEDLVDFAHPKGSHKLEGVSGDAVVETILDKHLKMLNVVNKKPTGKLSTAQAINSVKKALGQAAADPFKGLKDEFYSIRQQLAIVGSNYESLRGTSRKRGEGIADLKRDFEALINPKAGGELPSLEDFDDLYEKLYNEKEVMESGDWYEFGFGGVKEKAKDRLTGQFDVLLRRFKQIENYYSNFLRRINGYIRSLAGTEWEDTDIDAKILDDNRAVTTPATAPAPTPAAPAAQGTPGAAPALPALPLPAGPTAPGTSPTTPGASGQAKPDIITAAANRLVTNLNQFTFDYYLKEVENTSVTGQLTQKKQTAVKQAIEAGKLNVNQQYSTFIGQLPKLFIGPMKTIIKWSGIMLFAAFAYAATLPEPVKVYLIVSSRSGDYTIEKIFLIKQNAEKYRDMYKDHHNYVIEERNLTE